MNGKLYGAEEPALGVSRSKSKKKKGLEAYGASSGCKDQSEQTWRKAPIRCMTYDHGKPSCLRPTALARRFFGGEDGEDIEGNLWDLERVRRYIREYPQEASGCVVKENAWCPCPYGSDCRCVAFGTNEIVDCVRFALSKLQQMLKRPTLAESMHVLVLRIIMASYLPLTRLYDARETVRDFETAKTLVNADTSESCWSLPNIRDIVINCELWRKFIIYKEGTNDAKTAHWLKKTLPVRCHVRHIRRILAAYCNSKDKTFKNLLVSVLRCSLMGLFPGTEAPARYENMRIVDRLYCTGAANHDDPSEFALRHDYLLFFATKELLVFLVEGNPALRQFLHLTYNWGMFESQVNEVMKAVREALSQTERATEARILDLNLLARTMNKGQEKGAYKIRKAFPEQYLCTLMKDCRMPFDKVPLPVRYEPFQMALCAERLRRYYGVSERSAQWVKDVVALYHAKGSIKGKEAMFYKERLGSSNSLNKNDSLGISRYLRDTMISRTFSFAPLPEATRALQCMALKHRFSILFDADEKELYELTRTAFCLNCHTWKAPIPSMRASTKTNFKQHCLGNENVVARDGTALDDPRAEMLCRACFDDGQLFTFHMLGIVARVEKDTYMLCTSCAAICHLSPLTTIGDHMLCAHCLQNLGEEELNEALQLAVCVYKSCLNPLPTEPTAPRILLFDDDEQPKIVTICKNHRPAGFEAIRTSRYVSDVSDAIERSHTAYRQRKQAESKRAKSEGQKCVRKQPSLKRLLDKFGRGKHDASHDANDDGSDGMELA